MSINLPQWYRQPPRPDRITASGPDGARPTITVIVPTRNEAANLLPVLAGVRPYADELLVVDGHSTDGTRDIAVACGARVILDDGQGKGAAIRRGLEEATGDILVFIDADGSHDPRDIPALVAPILDGSADHVSGSRMLGGSDELHATLHQFVRLFGSQIITLTINYTLGVRLTDCQNGFRAIRREVAQQLDLREKITTIEQEMIIKTVRCGYRLVEVATHEYVRANGRSNFRVQDVWPRYLASLVYYLYLWQPPARAAQPRPVKATA
ncbi:MAG TPA: glycosyltransferase family 2 protein [Caldilineaceae bacterium]|nr:glycosyltransferase family 2 protein [Caldilineaceae bacterium]